MTLTPRARPTRLAAILLIPILAALGACRDPAETPPGPGGWTGWLDRIETHQEAGKTARTRRDLTEFLAALEREWARRADHPLTLGRQISLASRAGFIAARSKAPSLQRRAFALARHRSRRADGRTDQLGFQLIILRWQRLATPAPPRFNDRLDHLTARLRREIAAARTDASGTPARLAELLANAAILRLRSRDSRFSPWRPSSPARPAVPVPEAARADCRQAPKPGCALARLLAIHADWPGGGEPPPRVTARTALMLARAGHPGRARALFGRILTSRDSATSVDPAIRDGLLSCYWNLSGLDDPPFRADPVRVAPRRGAAPCTPSELESSFPAPPPPENPP